MRNGTTDEIGDPKWVGADDSGACPDDSEAAAEEIFEASSKAIAADLFARDKAKAEMRTWVHKTCYEFLSFIIGYGHVAVFEERIRRLERDSRSSDRVNPFQRGLLAVFANEPGLMDERDRSYFGKRLWYAYRHYVPLCFLMGFLHEVWSNDAERKVASNHIEPDYEQWILFERAKDTHPELRGRYPAALEENIERLKFMAPIMASRGERVDRFRQSQQRQLPDD